MDTDKTHDPFIRLTIYQIANGSLVRSPLFLEPEDVTQIAGHKVYLGSDCWECVESAEEIHAKVLEGLATKKQDEVLGK